MDTYDYIDSGSEDEDEPESKKTNLERELNKVSGVFEQKYGQGLVEEKKRQGQGVVGEKNRASGSTAPKKKQKT